MNYIKKYSICQYRIIVLLYVLRLSCWVNYMTSLFHFSCFKLCALVNLARRQIGLQSHCIPLACSIPTCSPFCGVWRRWAQLPINRGNMPRITGGEIGRVSRALGVFMGNCILHSIKVPVAILTDYFCQLILLVALQSNCFAARSFLLASRVGLLLQHIMRFLRR